jgi:dUTP pyrophosphatase
MTCKLCNGPSGGVGFKACTECARRISTPWPTLRVRRIGSHTLPLPAYAHEGDAGLDLRARLDEDWRIESGAREVIPCGFAFHIPDGFYGRIAPRSGLAVERGIDVGAGVIDAGYRGEVGVLLFNHGNHPFPFRVQHGDRIAQIIITPIARVVVEEAEELAPSPRGAAKYGSTGVR